MNVLNREYLHIPVYAWIAGGLALVLAVLYFLRHQSSNTGTTNAALPISANTGNAGVLPGAMSTNAGDTSTSTPPNPSSQYPWVGANPTTLTLWRNPLSGAIYLINQFGKQHLTYDQWVNLNSQGYTYTNVDPGQLANIPDAQTPGAPGARPVFGGTTTPSGVGIYTPDRTAAPSSNGALMLPQSTPINPMYWRPRVNPAIVPAA